MDEQTRNELKNAHGIYLLFDDPRKALKTLDSFYDQYNIPIDSENVYVEYNEGETPQIYEDWFTLHYSDECKNLSRLEIRPLEEDPIKNSWYLLQLWDFFQKEKQWAKIGLLKKEHTLHT